MTLTAFVSYSHADDRHLDRFGKHLAMLKRDGELSTWTDHAIVAGDAVDKVIDAQLEASELFVALLSPDYLASAYCYEKELARAKQLADEGRMRIVPIIVEPCDWLSSPFREYMALPKDGQPVSGFTNENNAWLNVVTGLRKMLEAVGSGAPSSALGIPIAAAAPGRKPRIKQDFDSIQLADYADKAFVTIRDYFRASCAEISAIGDDLRAKFEDVDQTSFTCTVVNRARRSGGEANITVHRNKSRSYGFGGDISYVNQKHAERNTSNGSIQVASDEYNMFLTFNRYDLGSGRGDGKVTPEQVSEELWNGFVQQAGIAYD